MDTNQKIADLERALNEIRMGSGVSATQAPPLSQKTGDSMTRSVERIESCLSSLFGNIQQITDSLSPVLKPNQLCRPESPKTHLEASQMRLAVDAWCERLCDANDKLNDIILRIDL